FFDQETACRYTSKRNIHELSGKMTSIRKQTITRWLAITAGACLISYAAQAPALMATLSALQALEVYDANTMPFIIGFALLLVAMASLTSRRSVSGSAICQHDLTLQLHSSLRCESIRYHDTVRDHGWRGCRSKRRWSFGLARSVK
ncbi:hypothetical protein, partial [Falsigemmobacter intermedius]|uniref:hypothetical protein n=1 Tax=Falsigemmobacter intermedius TaxID=1553448 RepID=UPI0035E8FE48